MTGNSNNKRGFVILFSVLLSTVILLVAAGIFTVARRELIFANTSREAVRAFNAATAGLECALFWDNAVPGTPNGSVFDPAHLGGATSGTITCGFEGNLNSTVDVDTITYYVDSANVYRFDMELYGAQDGCSSVYINTAHDSGTSIRVISRGFSRCDGDEPANEDPLLAERRIEATYPSS